MSMRYEAHLGQVLREHTPGEEGGASLQSVVGDGTLTRSTQLSLNNTFYISFHCRMGTESFDRFSFAGILSAFAERGKSLKTT